MKALTVLITSYFLIQSTNSLPSSDSEKKESQKEVISEESTVSDKTQPKSQNLLTESSTSDQPTGTTESPIITSNTSLQSQNESETNENKLTESKKPTQINSSKPLLDSLKNNSKPLKDIGLPPSDINLSQNESQTNNENKLTELNKSPEFESSSDPPLDTPDNNSKPLNDIKLPSDVMNYINNLSPSASRYFQRLLFPKLVLYPPGTPRGDMIVQMLTVLQRHNLESMMQSNLRRRKCRRHNHFLFGELENYVLSDIQSMILDFSDVIRGLPII